MSITAEKTESWVESELQKLMTDRSQVPDPHPLYAHLREHSPIRVHAGVTLVTAHKYVNALFRDPRFSRHEAAKREVRMLGDGGPEDQVDRDAGMAEIMMLINQDNPAHNRIRRIIDKVFRPNAVARWQDQVDTITSSLIDKVADRDEFDVLHDLGFPLPEAVICAMMGVPVEDHSLWSGWIQTSIGANTRTATPSAEARAAVRDAHRNFLLYFRELVARRRTSLSDDLVSELVRAEEEGERLSELELLGTLKMLISAGHETTANLLGNGMLSLIRNPDQYRRLREDPDLVANAVEELLRYETPSPWALPRLATEDIELPDGVILPKGSFTILAIASANRDSSVFPDGDKLDVTRENNRHLGFAAGPHFCLGSMLARMEAKAMFRAIVTRLPELELAEEPTWKHSFTRAMTGLKVRAVR